MAEPWVSTDDMAVHLGATKDSVYPWIVTTNMPADRVGHLRKFDASEVDHSVRRSGANDADGWP